jgi:hypothetical protein
MRHPLTDVQDGMAVYDRANEKIGTVRTVYLGSEPGAVTTGRAPAHPHSFLDDIVQALAPPAVPEVTRERLLREGFIRIDTSGPFAADRYAFASQIRGVSEAGVTLDATRDELLRR